MTSPEREDLEQKNAERAPEGESTNQKSSGIGSWVRFFLLVILIFAGHFAQPYVQPYIKAYLEGPQGAQTQQQAQQPPAPAVVLHKVKNADLAAESEYVGKVEALQSVSLKPRITGEISQVHFKEGSLVKEGDLLFTLDDKQYVATVDLRKADLAKAEANTQRASRYYERLKAADKRSVSASDLDIAENDVLQAKAGVAQAKASLRLAQIDLEYTKIAAPISGWIGRAELTKGNYVSPSSPALATIVQTNPVRVSFSLPDKLYLEQLSSFKSSDHSVYNATLRLSDGAAYPISGDRDFEDNIMDDKTGTITMRLRFPNDDGRLTPGAMVRLAVKPVQSHVAPVIPQEAILSDREGDYVYVVDSESVARLRRIESGAEVGSMREVISGLQATENIVVQGIQALRPNTPVRPIASANEGRTKTPAELAMASGYDAKTVPEGPK